MTVTERVPRASQPAVAASQPGGRHAKRLRRLLVLAALSGIALAVTPRLATMAWFARSIHDPATAPSAPLALVLGAGISSNDEPSPVLSERVQTAVDLYRTGKVQRLLFSGDGREPGHSETEAMRRMAVRLGVPESAITLDPQGLRTRASCERASETLGVTKALVVTQRFHLPRAMLWCQRAGIAVQGVHSDLYDYSPRWRLSWQARELGATAAAWLEIVTGTRWRGS